MKLSRKIVALLSVIAIASLVGTAVVAATPQGGPLQEIFAAILGLQDDVNTLQETSADATQLLASFDGRFVSPFEGEDVVPNAKITTDKPAIFTISVYASLKGAGDNAWIFFAPIKWSWAAIEEVEDADFDATTLTIAGYGVSITYRDNVGDDMAVSYSIVVQGEQGTVVTVGEWPS